MFKLHVYSQTGDIDQEVVIEGESATIGRASECNVVIDRKDISRWHARVLRGWVVDDLRSRNGTYVEGTKLEEATLVPSKSFEVGDPTSENLVTIEVISSERPLAAARDESDPEVTETGLEEEAVLGEPTTLPLPSEGDVAGIAKLRAELEAQTERYRYKCAKLEVELEALRRKFDSLLKGGGERRAAPEKKREDRPRHDDDPNKTW